ncbi:hypothetical protein HBE96_02910 [Clostridium sp. P21]|uniref:Lipoprotein n=1 Tax=Clostridium muellerianum TaxID=2716538 RepID=A0A7Y0EDY2_9CLOT|nr:hypothetical protein [Clostridium muellerianum]NMM61657.1 hypothetical protein [Clostridium muellerianum]
MKIKKCITALVATLVIACSTFPTSAYASTTTQKTTCDKTIMYTSNMSKTVNASRAMSLALYPGQSGYSNTVSFNFIGLPANAIVKSIKVDAGRGTVLGGLGAILPQKIKITNPAGESKEEPWGRGNVTTTSAFIADKAAGVWNVCYYGTNIASPSSGSQFIGGTKYASVKMTIDYVLE